MRKITEIKKYLEDYILPLYEKNDNAHNKDHIKYVVRRAVKFARLYKCDLSMIYAIAYFHDIGHNLNPKVHEIISAKKLCENPYIKNWFDTLEIQIMKEAIEDHRASNTSKPRSIYGEILSSADRSTNYKLAIKRSISYNISHCGRDDLHMLTDNVYNYLVNKYGDNGYSKICVCDHKYDRFIKKMNKLLNNKAKIVKLIKRWML